MTFWPIPDAFLVVNNLANVMVRIVDGLPVFCPDAVGKGAITTVIDDYRHPLIGIALDSRRLTISMAGWTEPTTAAISSSV